MRAGINRLGIPELGAISPAANDSVRLLPAEENNSRPQQRFGLTVAPPPGSMKGEGRDPRVSPANRGLLESGRQDSNVISTT